MKFCHLIGEDNCRQFLKEKVAAIDWRETDWKLLGRIMQDFCMKKEKERVGRGRMKYLFLLLMINLVLRYKAHIIFDRDDVG
jgi:hypothetical protein